VAETGQIVHSARRLHSGSISPEAVVDALCSARKHLGQVSCCQDRVWSRATHRSAQGL